MDQGEDSSDTAGLSPSQASKDDNQSARSQEQVSSPIEQRTSPAEQTHSTTEACGQSDSVVVNCSLQETQSGRQLQWNSETSSSQAVAMEAASEDDVPFDNRQDMEESSFRIVELPTEVLIHISSFLESRQILGSLCKVCSLFWELFSSDRYWKTRISLRWPKKYPIIEREDFNWRRGCMEREEKHRVWSNPDTQTTHVTQRDGFTAAVDVVHLLKGGTVLAIGSRDRSLSILDLNRFNPDDQKSSKDMLVYNDDKIHKGWVWSMASHDGILATGSWDTYVRLWDLAGGETQVSSTFKCKSALLGLYMEPGFVAAAGYDKRLYMFDPRDPESLIIKRYHSQPVLSVVADDKFVITGSEDNTISVYDRQAGKNYKKLEVESFVMDMSYSDGQLWFGDKQGKLNVMDATNGLFDNIQTFDVGHTGKLTGVCHTEGAIFTCATDGLVQVVEPSDDPGIIHTFQSHKGPVARVCYQAGVLASAGSDCIVNVWMSDSTASVLNCDTD